MADESPPILTIYFTSEDVIQKVVINDVDGSFGGGAGTYKNVCRIDFHDLGGVLRAIVPCDSSSTVTVQHDQVIFGLNLPVLLGPSALLPLVGTLVFATKTPLGFSTGMWIGKERIVAGNPDGTLVDYIDTLNQLSNPQPHNESQIQVGASPVAWFPAQWKDFNFGDALFCRIRDHYLPNRPESFPVLCLERAIPAEDDFGPRHLPAPFSISVASRTSGVKPTSSALRVAQRPVNDWLSNTTSAPDEWFVDVTNFQPDTIREFWQTGIVDRYIGAMQSVGDAEVISLLPTFSNLSDGSWRLRLHLGNAGSSPNLSLQVLGNLGAALPSSIPVDASCDGFLIHDGTGLAFPASMTTVADLNDVPGPAWIRFRLAPVTAQKPVSVRIGAIDLSLDPTRQQEPDQHLLDCTVTFEQARPAVRNYWVPRIKLIGVIPLTQIQPGGQDDPADPQYLEALNAAAFAGEFNQSDALAPLVRAFQREEALVIPVSTQDATPATGLSLQYTESSVPGANQALILTVNATDPTPGTGDVLLIDRNPFTVALTRLPSLTSAASAETDEIAQWSNSFPEGPGWRISAGAGSFQLLLPPQGIGEAMVTAEAVQGEPVPDAAIDFRFSPPAQAQLATSSQIQRYAEPGWNLRSLLGYPGERAPGAAVGAMQFEMLYQMSCQITTAGLNLSEIFSRLGGFAGPLTDASTGAMVLDGTAYGTLQSQWFNRLNQQWAATYKQLLSRLGILELWNQERSFNLLLSDGISYQLRSDTSADEFKGGARYALDLDQLLPAVQQNPRSSSGTLIDPRFSTLGGYGRQRAGFLSDSIAVESDVSMGLLNSLTVTVIGRIGNLWNRSKHVTVYERSVRPSRQFYLEQPLIDGRPILRKTSEYVEILQKTRAYPESGAAPPCGFLQGSEFKSIRINVDSAWRSTVPGGGWVIPLWRRDAVPADVYPRPHITLQLATDPDTGNDFQMAEVQNPEKLCFYTNPGFLSENQVNTDNWPAVLFVDYCNTLPRRSIDDKKPDFSIEPGFGQFTYLVAADAAQVNLVSQRTDKTIASALRNVTFMRAQNGLAAPQNVADVALMSAGQLHDYVNNTLDQLRSAVAAATTANPPLSAIQSALAPGTVIDESLVGPFQTACNLAGKLDDSGLCTTLVSAAQTAFLAAVAPLEQQWNLLLANVAARLTVNVQNDNESLKNAFFSAVDAAFAGFQSALGPVLCDLSAAASVAAEVSGVANAVINDLNQLEELIQAAPAPPPAPDANWLRWLIVAQRCADDISAMLADVQFLLDSVSFLFGTRCLAVNEVRAVSAGLRSISEDLNLSSQFNSLVAAVRAMVAKEAITAIGEMTAALDPTKEPVSILVSGLTGLSTKLAGAAGTANSIASQVRALREDLRARIKAVTTAVLADFTAAIQKAFSLVQPPDTESAKNAIGQQVQNTCINLLGTIANAVNELTRLLSFDEITKGLPAAGDISAYLEAIDDLQTNYTALLDALVQRCRETVGTDTNAVTSASMTLLRAFGAPPQVPGLTFQLDSAPADAIAYFYTDLKQAGTNLVYDVVDAIPVSAGLTSAVAQISAAAGQLQQLNIQGLPTQAVLDRLVPNADLLKGMDLSDLLPHVAGLDLSKLFSGISVPDVASDNIHISHHIDPQTLTVALDITLDFPIANSQEITLFSIGPVTVSLESCIFHAEVHVGGGAGQAAVHTSSGSITANWRAYIAGTELITFVKTALTFDEGGHLQFDVQPSRVQLAAVLQFLAELIEAAGIGGGFSLNPLPDAIQCILDLPMPPLSGGAFAITNLSLGCLFGIVYSPDFAISVGANLGRKKAPFSLTVAFLGGGGWVETSATYTPRTGTINADVSIGITATAGIAVDLGVLSGSVSINLGIVVEYHSAGSLDVGILILVQGHVSLLGIVDADVTLLLEAEYQSGGGLIGRGEVDVSIKICWCFTLEIHKSVEITFKSSGGSRQVRGTGPAPAAARLRADVASLMGSPAGRVEQTPDVGLYAQAASNRINFLT